MVVGNLCARHRSGQWPPPLFPDLLSLQVGTAALFPVNVSFDLASAVIVGVAFLASTQVFENLSKC